MAAAARGDEPHDYFFFFFFRRRRDWPDSDMAIAIACLRLFTLRPEPLLSLPFLCLRMTLATFFRCRRRAAIITLLDY